LVEFNFVLSYRKFFIQIFLGGNDALSYMQRLNTSVQNLGEGLIILNEIKKEFEEV
jgi:hypothetical protein